jgi:UDP-N-acetylmuramyl tripeptide synthase
MVFELDEVRRLTGANLLSDMPGAIIDVNFSDVEADVVIDCWNKHLHHCQISLGPEYAWQSTSYHRVFDGGASMSISAPMDLLYSACDLIELAWDLCVADLCTADNQTITSDMLLRLAALQETIAQEKHPELLALMLAAEKQGVVCLADDDELSLGMGAKSDTWRIDDLPEVSTICWQEYAQIPIALITGTNGKSTSVRLAAEIAKCAGIKAGVTSTDFIKVGDVIIDEGDYSGPGGARMLLRDKRSEMAFLEVARGGLLRRGLPVSRAQAALVTNVASDHLGQYGINTVAEIALVKTMVSKGIMPGSDYSKGTLVLNADDPLLVKASTKLNVPICWFSLDEQNTLIKDAQNKQNPCVYQSGNDLIYSHYKQISIAEVSNIPMTVNGTAKHNIENALGVIGLCKALNISEQNITSGLSRFASNASDNPGRGNIYTVNGVSVIVDFAHNPHSMQALVNMASHMTADKKHVMFSHAGDRSDEDIIDVTNAVRQLNPDTYCLAEIEKYLRGRELNEISQIVKDRLLSSGVSAQSILLANDPLEGTKQIMQRAAEGDIVLLFVLNDREKIQSYLTELSSLGSS